MMKTTETRIAVLCCLAAAATIAAPAAAFAARPIRFDRLSMEQGLSQSSVTDIVQDRRGYVWLATEDGLNRFDGTSFKVYRHDPADERSLPSSFVWDIEPDESGDLWIGTSAGLARWERARDRIVPQERVTQRHVRALALDPKQGVLWIGTRDAGLVRFEIATGAVAVLSHNATDPASLCDNRIFALRVDRTGRLWVGTDNGLDLLDGRQGGFVHVAPRATEASSLSDGRIRAVLEDDAGAVWVGTLNSGLNRLDPKTGRFERFRHDPQAAGTLAHDQVRSLLQDADGRL